MKYFILALITLVSLTACSSLQPKEPINSIKPIDQSVVAAVKMNLKTDTELATCSIQVSAENRLLVLRGTVPSEEAKEKAEKIAQKSLKDAKVANHLEVSEP